MVNIYIFYHGRKVLGSQNISFIMRIRVQINNITWIPHSEIWVRFIYGGTVVDLGKEILKAIQIMVDKKLDNYKADITYQSIIKDITPKGYVILDRSGQERTVQCSIPGSNLRMMQSVWVKEPMGNLKRLHIVGVVVK